MIDAEINEYNQTRKVKEVKEVMEQKVQDAVVRSIIDKGYITRLIEYEPDNHARLLECVSPVWGTFYMLSSIKYEDVRRGDVLEVSRRMFKLEDVVIFDYVVHCNKTLEEEKQKGINKILKGFDDAQCQNIFNISAYQRRNGK